MTGQNWTKSYKVTVETMEPMHIGGAKETLSDVDNPIVRINGKPAIPATTIKGAWRSEIERHLILLLESQNKLHEGEILGLKPCIPTSKPSSDENKVLRNKFKSDSNKLSACDYNQNSTYICPACYLLGAQTLHGFIRVPFLLLETGQQNPDNLLYSIRGDRVTGGGAHGTNRAWQVIEPGVKFTGIIEILVADKLRQWHFGRKRDKLSNNRNGNMLDKWLDHDWNEQKIRQQLIVDRLQSITILGGYKFKGCGNVKVTVTTIP